MDQFICDLKKTGLDHLSCYEIARKEFSRLMGLAIGAVEHLIAGHDRVVSVARVETGLRVLPGRRLVATNIPMGIRREVRQPVAKLFDDYEAELQRRYENRGDSREFDQLELDAAAEYQALAIERRQR